MRSSLYLLKHDDDLHDNAEFLGTLLCPTPPKINDPDWSDIARSILVGCLKLMAKNPARPVTLPHLALMVRPGETETGESGWKALAAEMLDFGLDDYAGEILSRMKSPRQFEGYISRVHNATNPYRQGTPLGEHVAKDGFNPDDLKHKDVTVYVISPSDKLSDTAKAWLRLVMSLMAEAVGRPGPARDVLFLAEEFANLGYMPTIGRAMAQYRESGLKAWLIIQNLGQLDTIYGPDGAREIVNLCETRQFFGINDLETARIISAAAGQTTVRTQSQNQQPRRTAQHLFTAAVAAGGARRAAKHATPQGQRPTVGAFTGFASAAPHILDAFQQPPSTSYSETGIPLIRPETILHNMPANKQIILRRGCPPIRAWLTPYFKDPILWERADPNPYREDGKGPRPLTKEEKEAAAKEAEAKENAPPDWAVKYDNLPIYYHGPFGFIALALMFDYPENVVWFLDIFLIAFIALGIPSALETVSRGLKWSYKKLKNS